jgi:hypothetical protein
LQALLKINRTFSFNYLVESLCVVSLIIILDVSLIIELLVSAGAIVDDVSVVVLVESVVLELEPLLHAAKTPIAKTINSFFICLCFFVM